MEKTLDGKQGLLSIEKDISGERFFFQVLISETGTGA